MDSALLDFAEAAMGKNTEMSWSLSPEVLRRQIGPVFDLCASKELSAEEALDVAIEFVNARVSNILEVFTKLFDSFRTKADIQMHGVDFPASMEIEEFLLGLDSESQWAIDGGIARRELHTLFEKVYSGVYSTRTGVAVFCDTIKAKRDFLLERMQDRCMALALQVQEAREAKKAQEPAPDPEGPERLANGDD